MENLGSASGKLRFLRRCFIHWSVAERAHHVERSWELGGPQHKLSSQPRLMTRGNHWTIKIRAGMKSLLPPNPLQWILTADILQIASYETTVHRIQLLGFSPDMLRTSIHSRLLHEFVLIRPPWIHARQTSNWISWKVFVAIFQALC